MNRIREDILLSVIVPVYGVEEYLSECVSSILNQTYKNLEVILVDDGAKGKEPELCDEFAERDSRVIVIHKQNAGLVAARKTGLKKATAEYVTFVDGDDYLAPDYYERIVKLILSDDPDLIAVSFTQVEGGNYSPIEQSIPNGTYESERLQWLFENMNCVNEEFYHFGLWPSTCLKVYKTSKLRESIVHTPTVIRLGEDSSVTFPYLLKCEKVVVDNTNKGYFYRILPESMARTCDQSLFTGTDALYHYLKPQYASKNNELVMRQLEITRAYLLSVAFEYWMTGVRYKAVRSQLQQIRSIIEDTALFEDAERLMEFDLPEELLQRICFIQKGDWKGFEYWWKKKLVLSCLHTMARKLLRRA